MKNNSVNCVIDFSAAKMLKMGFWAGVGMFAAKTLCIALFGKAAISAATAAGKRGVKNGANKIFDELKNTINEKADEDPDTFKQLTDELSQFKVKLEETAKKLESKGK